MPVVLVEPPRAPGPPRWPAYGTLSGISRLSVGAAASAAALLLVCGGRGDLWVLAALIAVADASVAPAVVVVAAGVMASGRYGSAGLAEVAGAQSVLGLSGLHGRPVAVATAWAVAAALVLAGRRRAAGLACGALAAVLVAGPSTAAGPGDLALRAGAIAIGAATGWALARGENARAWQPIVAVVVSVTATGLFFAVSS